MSHSIKAPQLLKERLRVWVRQAAFAIGSFPNR
jgi:hypothetical protein